MTTRTNATGERIVGSEGRPSTNAELMDVVGVAKLLSCSPRTVYRLAGGSRMPRPVKIGVLVRWRVDELRRWIDAGCPPVRAGKGGWR